MASNRYLISLTDENAAKLEKWLGGRLMIYPAGPVPGATLASLDAITEEEYAPIHERLRSGGPLYHHGGPTGGG